MNKGRGKVIRDDNNRPKKHKKKKQKTLERKRENVRKEKEYRKLRIQGGSETRGDRDRERGEGEGEGLGLGSQFFIASSDLPSQEYFLALPQVFPLAHDPAGSPCIRSSSGCLDYVARVKRNGPRDKLRRKRRHMSPSFPLNPPFPGAFSPHTRPPRYVFPRHVFLHFFFHPRILLSLLSAFCVVSPFFLEDLYKYISFFAYLIITSLRHYVITLLLHYSLGGINLRIVHTFGGIKFSLVSNE